MRQKSSCEQPKIPGGLWFSVKTGKTQIIPTISLKFPHVCSPMIYMFICHLVEHIPDGPEIHTHSDILKPTYGCVPACDVLTHRRYAAKYVSQLRCI